MKDAWDSVGAMLQAQAARLGAKTALIEAGSGGAFTYEELASSAARWAARLKSLGVRRGQRVAAAPENEAAWIHALLGLWWMGAVPILIDPRLKAGEAGELLQACGARALLCLNGRDLWPSLRGRWRKLRSAAPQPGAPRTPPAPLAGGEPALIWPTSGTSGKPKGALITHASLLARWSAAQRGDDGGGATLCLLPLSFGLIHPCGSFWHNGGCVVLSAPFDLKSAASLWPTAARHGVEAFLAVPTIIRLLSELGPRSARPALTLRRVFCVGATLTPAAASRFERLYGVPVIDVYGLKETGPIAMTPLKPRRRRPGIFEPLVSGRIRVDAGEIVFSGPGLASGYMRGGRLDRRAFAGGWFRTGDLGILERDGSLRLTGRASDTIIRNGLNIRPEEVEGALLAHPLVREAAAFGVPDPRVGERVGACVVTQRGVKLSTVELGVHCRRLLADYKCPERVSFLARLPSTPLGKMRREELRRLLT